MNSHEEYHKMVLDNGLRILTSNMPHTRSVSIGFFVAVGSRYEEDKQAGVSHFIEHMLFKGTEERPTAKDIAVAIEGIGGVINGSTGREATAYGAKVAQHYLDVAVDVLSDMLLHAKFDPLEIEKERRVITEEINLLLDTPDALVYLLAYELLWPDHPLGRDVIGTKESVRNLNREAMLAYLRCHYGPANTVVSVAGNVEHEEVVELVSAYLGDWAGGGGGNSFRPAEDDQAKPRLRLQFKDAEQAHLCLGLPGLERDHSDRFGLGLLSCILGEGMSSRLFSELRERLGLAYSVSSYLIALRDTGMVGIHAGVDPSRIAFAIETILGECEKLRREKVLAEELIKAKEFVKGRLALQMEDTSSVAAWFGQQELLSAEVLTVDEAFQAIEAVTAADIQRIASKIFGEEKLNLAVVGPFREEGDFRRSLGL